MQPFAGYVLPIDLEWRSLTVCGAGLGGAIQSLIPGQRKIGDGRPHFQQRASKPT